MNHANPEVNAAWMPRPTLILKSSVIDKFPTRPGRERAVPKFDHTPDLRSAGQLMAAHCIKWGSSGFDLVGPLLGNPPIVGLEDSPRYPQSCLCRLNGLLQLRKHVFWNITRRCNSPEPGGGISGLIIGIIGMAPNQSVNDSCNTRTLLMLPSFSAQSTFRVSSC